MKPEQTTIDKVGEDLKAFTDALNASADAAATMEQTVNKFELEQFEEAEKGYQKHLNILLNHFRSIGEQLNGSKNKTGETVAKDLELMIKFSKDFAKECESVSRTLLKVSDNNTIEKTNAMIGKYVNGINEVLKKLR